MQKKSVSIKNLLCSAISSGLLTLKALALKALAVSCYQQVVYPAGRQKKTALVYTAGIKLARPDWPFKQVLKIKILHFDYFFLKNTVEPGPRFNYFFRSGRPRASTFNILAPRPYNRTEVGHSSYTIFNDRIVITAPLFPPVPILEYFGLNLIEP